MTSIVNMTPTNFVFVNDETVVSLLDVKDPFPDIVTRWVMCYTA